MTDSFENMWDMAPNIFDDTDTPYFLYYCHKYKWYWKKKKCSDNFSGVSVPEYHVDIHHLLKTWRMPILMLVHTPR